MLTDSEKHLIRQGLRGLSARMPGYRERKAQLRLMGSVVRAVDAGASGHAADGQNVAVVEAPTGTGKSLGLALSSVVMAHTRRKRVVLSSSTVALMEQMLRKDLPIVAEVLPFSFSVAVAKGRRRYACVARLNARAAVAGSNVVALSADRDAGVLPDLARRLACGEWDGDRDSLTARVSSATWESITNDEVGCTGPACPHKALCPYLRARERMAQADVIVTNHDYLMSALRGEACDALGGLQDMIVIADEAHALPEASVKAQTHSFGLGHLTTALGDMPDLARRVARGLRLDGDAAAAVERNVERMRVALRRLEAGSRHLLAANPAGALALTAGPLPMLSAALTDLHDSAVGASDALQALRCAVLDRAEVELEAAEKVLGWMSPALRALEQTVAACKLLRDERSAAESAAARWIETTHNDVRLCAAPLIGAPYLHDRLWTRARAAIATSATLRACGSFDSFLRDAGLDALRSVSVSALPSPYTHFHESTLLVPRLASSPRDPAAHTAEVSALLPDLIWCRGTLVLFASDGQMRAVYDSLPADLQQCTLVQGRLGKAALLHKHAERIRAGHRSIIFGLASFYEGVDLPGHLLEHVIIVKLPFRVPDTPIEKARAEACAARGRSYFAERALPEVALKLAQAAGRLVRSETDRGVVTILDSRVAQTGWGRRLLADLPPMRRVLLPADWRRFLPTSAHSVPRAAATAARRAVDIRMWRST